MGAIAVIGGAHIPVELEPVTQGLGINLISDLLIRVARGELPTEEEITELHETIEKSDIQQLLTKRDYLSGFGRLIRRLDMIGAAIKEGETDLAELLIKQYSQHQILLVELHDYLLVIQSELPKLATKEQANAIIAILNKPKGIVSIHRRLHLTGMLQPLKIMIDSSVVEVLNVHDKKEIQLPIGIHHMFVQHIMLGSSTSKTVTFDLVSDNRLDFVCGIRQKSLFDLRVETYIEWAYY